MSSQRIDLDTNNTLTTGEGLPYTVSCVKNFADIAQKKINEAIGDEAMSVRGMIKNLKKVFSDPSSLTQKDKAFLVSQLSDIGKREIVARIYTMGLLFETGDSEYQQPKLDQYIGHIWQYVHDAQALDTSAGVGYMYIAGEGEYTYNLGEEETGPNGETIRRAKIRDTSGEERRVYLDSEMKIVKIADTHQEIIALKEETIGANGETIREATIRDTSGEERKVWLKRIHIGVYGGGKHYCKRGVVSE